MEHRPGQHAGHGQRAGPLRQEYSTASGHDEAAQGTRLAPACSFSDSEAGFTGDSITATSEQLHSLQQSSPGRHRKHSQEMHRVPAAAAPHAHGAAQQPAQQATVESQPAQQQQQKPKQQAAATVARVIAPHLSRPAVTRGLLHHLAKACGIRIKGDVATNEISTAKYTFVTFLPRNLFEQFLRVANMYFLLMVILQLIPGLSPTSIVTTVAPLVFVLAVNAIKEGYDDVQRHRNDNQINNRLVLLLSKEHGEQKVYWKDVVAGDLIKVMADEEVPADLVVLSTPDPDNLCYVETANLDGETNLKIKYCWPGYTQRSTVHDFECFAQTCRVGCEQPNPKLYVFDGYMEVADHGQFTAQPGPRSTRSPRVSKDAAVQEEVPLSTHKEALDINNLLLRGSVLKKTDWAIGLAVNVGDDSKIVQNMTKAPRKVTQLERAMNVLVFVQFSALVIFSAVLAGLEQDWSLKHMPTEWWYLQYVNNFPANLEPSPGALGWFVQFLRFIILLSNMIPISLYVSLEVVKVFQCTLLLNSDREMYHEETDTPFVCRTTTLNEELGQVQYVLSDKTGTLTQNIMGFVWASVGGKLYGRNLDKATIPKGMPAKVITGQGECRTPHTIALDTDIQKAAGTPMNGGTGHGQAAADMHRFLLNLAVCNTVVPTVGPDGSLLYQASSPDEEALVEGAAYLGYRLLSRTTEQVKVSVHGQEHTFDVLATLEFNSDRKRMSIIVRTPEDKLLLMCKGADSIILGRLAKNEPGRATVIEHLDEMAHGGYRTLLISDRELRRDEYEKWQVDYLKASVALDNRDQQMADKQSEIETGLRLVGATAVEDKLQDGVPDCLRALAQAGIKVWVLTGDKVETAISIAYSCQLFAENMQIVEVREQEVHEKHEEHGDQGVVQVLADKLAKVRSLNQGMQCMPGHSEVGIVIEGGALHLALAPSTQDALLELCKECRAVVCCRVTPMQKAQIVLMVKKKANAITLGIGDGANDVGMIRAAHIGVGISGREGRAAVLASDFSFAQFRYLSRLLLLHGRWNYMRNKEVVLYSFYKNWAYVLVYVYLQFVAGFSAQPIFTTMMISTFNMIFTACPIVAYAVLEQDLRKHTVLKHPETYSQTRTETRASFFRQFIVYVYVIGTWHSLPSYFLPWYSMVTPDRAGLHGDLSAVGTAVFICLVLTVTLKLSLRTHCWSWITHLVYWLSLALLFPFVYVLSILWDSTDISGVADMSGVGVWLFTNATFWLSSMCGASAIALLPDLAVMLFRRYIRPGVATLLQEGELMEYVRSTGNKGRDKKNIFGVHSEGSDTKERKAGSPPKARGSPLIPRGGKRPPSKTGLEMQVAAAGPAGVPVAEGHTGDWQGGEQHPHQQRQHEQQQFAQQPGRRASAGMLQQPHVSQQQTLPGVV